MATVLVVDGEQAQFKLLREILDDIGYTTIWTANPAEALRLAHREAPGLIILDNDIPGTDPSEVILLLKQEPSTARIPLLLLYDGSVSALLSSLESDASMVLEKPIDPVELATTVHCLLHAPDAHSAE